MFCVCYAGLPVREVVPDPEYGLRINVASSIDSDFLRFQTREEADIFADFVDSFSVEDSIIIRKVI